MSPMVDFTTFELLPGIPVKGYTVLNAGSDTTLTLHRVGNLVIASGTFVSAGTGQYDDITINNRIPLGYRPSSTINEGSGVWIPFVCTRSDDLGQGAWRILPDGSMRFSNARGFSGAKRFAYNAVYFTDDEWPS